MENQSLRQHLALQSTLNSKMQRLIDFILNSQIFIDILYLRDLSVITRNKIGLKTETL